MYAGAIFSETWLRIFVTDYSLKIEQKAVKK